MAIYAKLSPQASIKKLTQILSRNFKRILNDDLEFDEFIQISLINLKTSLKFVFIIIGPTFLSALPVLLVSSWIYTHLAFDTIPREKLIARSATADEPAQTLLITDSFTVNVKIPDNNELTEENVSVLNESGELIYSGNPINPPTPKVYKRQWLNLFLESPVGYVEQNASVSSVEFNIPKKRLVQWMPEWGQGWEFPFFITIFIAALAIKLIFKIV
jgi:hypothetical protein